MSEELPAAPVEAGGSEPVPAEAGGELLLLPDGRILAHHLTPELAAFVREVLNTPDKN